MAASLRTQILEWLPETAACFECSGTGKMGGALCSECVEGRITVSPPIVGTMHGIAARLTGMALRGELAGGDRIRDLGWIRGTTFGIAIPEDVDNLIDAANPTWRDLNEG